MERESQRPPDVEVEVKLKIRAQWRPALLMWFVVSVFGAVLLVWLGR